MALPGLLPTAAELFESCAMRSSASSRAHADRGTSPDRHPWRGKRPRSSRPAPPGPIEGDDDRGARRAWPTEIWITDGELVRTYAAAHRGAPSDRFEIGSWSGRSGATRNGPRLRALTALPNGDTPGDLRSSGRLCQNVLANGRRTVDRVGRGHTGARRCCSNAHTASHGGRRRSTDFHISMAVERETGVILRFIESIGGSSDPPRRSRRLRAGRIIAPSALEFVFPHRDNDALLTRGLPVRSPARIVPPFVPGPPERRGRALSRTRFRGCSERRARNQRHAVARDAQRWFTGCH